MPNKNKAKKRGSEKKQKPRPKTKNRPRRQKRNNSKRSNNYSSMLASDLDRMYLNKIHPGHSNVPFVMGSSTLPLPPLAVHNSGTRNKMTTFSSAGIGDLSPIGSSDYLVIMYSPILTLLNGLHWEDPANPGVSTQLNTSGLVTFQTSDLNSKLDFYHFFDARTSETMSTVYGTDLSDIAEKGVCWSGQYDIDIIAPNANKVGVYWSGRLNVGQFLNMSLKTGETSISITVDKLIRLAGELQEHNGCVGVKSSIVNHNIVSEITTIGESANSSSELLQALNLLGTESISFAVINRGAMSITDQSNYQFSLASRVSSNWILWPRLSVGSMALLNNTTSLGNNRKAKIPELPQIENRIAKYTKPISSYLEQGGSFLLEKALPFLAKTGGKMLLDNIPIIGHSLSGLISEIDTLLPTSNAYLDLRPLLYWIQDIPPLKSTISTSINASVGKMYSDIVAVKVYLESLDDLIFTDAESIGNVELGIRGAILTTSDAYAMGWNWGLRMLTTGVAGDRTEYRNAAQEFMLGVSEMSQGKQDGVDLKGAAKILETFTGTTTASLKDLDLKEFAVGWNSIPWMPSADYFVWGQINVQNKEARRIITNRKQVEAAHNKITCTTQTKALGDDAMFKDIGISRSLERSRLDELSRINAKTSSETSEFIALATKVVRDLE